MRVRFLSPAEVEMNDAAAFYEQQADGLGDRFLTEIERCIAQVALQRDIGHRVRGELRRVLARKFPYSTAHGASREELTVVAIAHQSRRPHYWVECVAR